MKNLPSRQGAFRPWFTLFAAVFMACGLVAPLGAREKNDLDISLTASRVERNVAGAEILRPANTVVPGDLLEYRGVYLNQGIQPLRSLAPTLPVPQGMEYVAGTASPAPVAASLDGKSFEPMPIRRARSLPDGRTMLVEVPASAYRALRWNAGELAAGAHFTISSRMRVLNSPLVSAR